MLQLRIAEQNEMIPEDGILTGAIYFELDDGNCFPCEGWVDVPLCVMTWLAESALKLYGCTKREARLDFMEGPYHVILRREDDVIHWSFEQMHPKSVMYICDTPYSHLLDLALIRGTQLCCRASGLQERKQTEPFDDEPLCELAAVLQKLLTARCKEPGNTRGRFS